MDETTVTRIFIKVLNQCEGLVPGLKLAACGQRPDLPVPGEGQQTKTPDLALFRTSSVPLSGNPRWCEQLIAVIITSPTHDNGRGGSNGDSDAKSANAFDYLSRVELMFIVQQRLAVFTLLVVQRQCHLIRWDHSGFILTNVIDYFLEWRYFTEVLWRISQCSDAQLGLDPTAHLLLPGDPEYRLMSDLSRSLASDIDHTERVLNANEVSAQEPYVFSYIRTAFAQSLHPLWPRYRLEVPHDDRTKTFLIGKPRFRAKGLFGRATRGYVALDCETGAFAWLKDVWRVHRVLAEREGDIIGRLNEAEVTHVPTLLCHGDLEGQVTLTPQRWEEKYARAENEAGGLAGRKRKQGDEEGENAGRRSCPLRHHQHYRLVVKEVALPLSEFQFGRQLVSVVNDCVFAHYMAYETLSVLHGDVSSGNVLIYPRLYEAERGWILRLTGMLADWEMARPVSLTRADALGTMPFMSVARLSRHKPVEICDEMESFFYILLYFAVRYLRSPCSDHTVANFLDRFFDQYSFADGRWVCGSKKLNTIATGNLSMAYTVPLTFDGNLNMDRVIGTLLSWFKAHHAVWRHRLCQQELERSGSVAASRHDESTPPSVSPFPVSEPSAHDRKLASQVVTHHDMVRFLTEMEGLPGWPTDDKVGDRIPTSWRRDNMYESDGDPSHTSLTKTINKKMRTE
ncbi:hypothetical protein C8T65DRAFT_740413 [Cerioporus squamosus]|nr:hypothetical protein C8T65DRAFT_740413 [Cerioporus squamosus]